MKAGKFILAIIFVFALMLPSAFAGSYFFDSGFGGAGFYDGFAGGFGRCPYGGYYCDGFGSDYVQFVTGAGVRPKLADLESTAGTFSSARYSSPFNQRIVGAETRSSVFYGASAPGAPIIVAVPSYYGFYDDSPAVRPVKRIESGKGQQIFGSRGFTTPGSSSRRKRVIGGGESIAGAVRESTDAEGRRVFRVFN